MKAEASNQKIAWFHRENQARTLNLSPDFQRNPIWVDEQASYLIDTVLLGLPFPEIYLRSKTSAAGTISHEVVDGQQRIRALLRFGANDLTLDGDEVSQKYKGRTFDDLSEAEQKKFWNYTVVVRDLGDASDADIRDLFRRLNKNSVVLNAQELRNARFKGKFITLMEELADDPWWVDSRIVNPRQVRRMEDIEFVSELFVGIMGGPQNKKETLDDYYATYERTFPEKEKHEQRFRETKAAVVYVLGRDDLIEWSGRSDFYSLFLAFSQFREEKLTQAQARKVSDKLMAFRHAVDEAKKKDADEVGDKTVWRYAQAVTRAASDIDRRKERIVILTELITRALGR